MHDLLEILKLTPDLRKLELHCWAIQEEPFFSSMDAAASSRTLPHLSATSMTKGLTGHGY